MKLTDLLKGKTVRIMTDAKVEVYLEIENADEKNNSRDLEPATRENDWWPNSENWKTYPIKFTNGYVKVYNSIESIDVVEDIPNDRLMEMRKSASNTIQLLGNCDYSHNEVKVMDELAGYVMELTNKVS